MTIRAIANAALPQALRQAFRLSSVALRPDVPAVDDLVESNAMDDLLSM
jgi:hypothetical protein